MTYPYPEAPAHAPAELTQPKDSFRQQVGRVVATIFAFIAVYLLLVVAAGFLTYGCLKAGWFVITRGANIWFILIGAGVIVLGGLVLFFLIKFLFASSDATEEHGIEITEQDEPELFAFLGRIVDEVGTHFPRHVYLIPGVNASVFYNSSFWSLFFPTRKNLNIGLGMVNALNVSEFKAVLAHEFGHFAQDSMRLGSYVYYVNQLIFNMLYRNDGWAGAANSIASIHEVMYLFAKLAVYIVQGVQWILQQMYRLINLQYMRLSREMEFHADAVSARYTGSNLAEQALRQVSVADDLYNDTINTCNALLPDNKAPLSVYAGQRAHARHFAEVFDLPLSADAPVISSAFLKEWQLERVNFKDQWASHPTHAEREAHLQAINLPAEPVLASAWSLFRNPGRWEQEMTRFLYRGVEQQLEYLDDTTFAAEIMEQHARQDFPKRYRGYFNHHIVETSNWEETLQGAAAQAVGPQEADSWFQERFDHQLGAIQRDLATLMMIRKGEVNTKTFDFDGQKRPVDDAFEVYQQLEKELEAQEKARSAHDRMILRRMYGHALQLGDARAAAFRAQLAALAEAAAWWQEMIGPGKAAFDTLRGLAENDFYLATELAAGFREMCNTQVPALRILLKKLPCEQIFSEEDLVKIQAAFPAAGDLELHTNMSPIKKNLETLAEGISVIGKQLDEVYKTRNQAFLKEMAGLLP
jgi:Zn-dependent protease with chaperone function